MQKILDFLRNSLLLEKLAIFMQIGEKILKAYEYIRLKNFSDKMPKRAILTIKWSCEGCLLKVTLCLLVLLMTQCQKEQTKGMTKKLVLNLQEGDLPSLHPAIGIDLRSRCLFLALYEPLMRRAPEGKLNFAQAESVDIDATETVYTFHLRENFWSNGEKVTAHHFDRAWKYALDPVSLCVRADLFYPIKNGEKVKKEVAVRSRK